MSVSNAETSAKYKTSTTNILPTAYFVSAS